MLKNIKSFYILEIILKHVKKRRIMTIIQHSKNLMNKLDLKIGDYILEYIDKKYNFEIKDAEEINLSHHKLERKPELLSLICKTNLTALTQIYFGCNNLSNFSDLIYANFSNLEVLNMDSNKIDNIDFLGNVHFENLLKLGLSNNLITDISVLERLNFKKLEYLGLSFNRITDVSVFERVNFINLKSLFLQGNNFNQETFPRQKFKDLKELVLSIR